MRHSVFRAESGDPAVTNSLHSPALSSMVRAESKLVPQLSTHHWVAFIPTASSLTWFQAGAGSVQHSQIVGQKV